MTSRSKYIVSEVGQDSYSAGLTSRSKYMNLNSLFKEYFEFFHRPKFNVALNRQSFILNLI